MNAKKLLHATCIVVLATIYLHAEKLSAQAPPPETPTAVVTSASGAERHLLSHDRVVDRVGLGPNQVVTVTLTFTSDMAGTPVMVTSLDGGQVTASVGLSVGGDGKVAFSFQGGGAPGLYRLIAQLGANDYRLEFYVLDPVHPQNNPPRLRIVN